ncbi:nuclear transport factor 2 family protein [Serratia marcescens]|uniref:Nuclear transport factor 2 family protein n=1 Tax=Serratia marcescens TaxID=615 RepID=A0A939NLX9_SERMA|nr:nuclear transport factor 2 family protein [Serratia marcescens]
MTQLTPLDLVLDTLQLVVASPEHRPTQLAARFSADYRQQVDGKVLNFEQFEQHMALLKRQTRRMTLSVIAVAAQGEAVLTHHLVELEKRDGACSRVGAGALHRAWGRICACDELTELLAGAPGDRDLGSRVSE